MRFPALQTVLVLAGEANVFHYAYQQTDLKARRLENQYPRIGQR